MFFNSIRVRLQIWYGVILLAVLAGFGVTAYQLESGRQWRRIDSELQRRANILMGVLRGPGPRERGPGDRFPMRPSGDEGGEPNRDGPPAFERGTFPGNGPRGGRFQRPPAEFRLGPQQAALFDAEDASGFYFVVWSRDDSVLARSTNAPAIVPVPIRPEARGPQPPRFREPYRESFLITPPGEIVLVGRSIAREKAELRRVALILSSVGGVILLLGLAGGWWLASRAIRPIRDISGTALKIAGGDLSQRINVADTENELGQLASVLNSTFTRLDKAFAQQQQFTSDAAHELRTPVSVILTQTQTALNRERNAGEYRETVEACQRSAQRMRRLIESLLELARLDAGQETLRRAPFDLARTVSDCVELTRPLAADRGIIVYTELQRVECEGDAERVAQVITNLLSNAVHHGHQGGAVRVATRRDGEFAVADVSDNGPGIPAEHLPHVFERFYRVDAARTTSSGRSGLGLAISKAIIEAHAGSIQVFSEPGKGSVFTVRLPVGSIGVGVAALV
jgi:two-component system OmpR family sensor kinase